MDDKDKPLVCLYSDGGAEPNPGPGGFGVILEYKGHKKELSKGYQLTTNNRMELLGVIFGLENLKKPSNVEVYSDSKYLVNAVNEGWVVKWQENNWFRNKKERAVNIDLWKRLLVLMETHTVNFNWVKGHNGHLQNERCDELAGIALKGQELIEDVEYIKSINAPAKDGKIKNVGDECRKCNTPVIKKINKKRKIKKNKNYYFEFWLICPNCKTTYMVEEAKKLIIKSTNTLFD